MEWAWVVIPAVALGASLLTLISGFGLGTIMLPVFSLFFDVTTAVAMTAVVHILNNIFKTGILGSSVDWKVLARFGIPGILGAFLGATLLTYVAVSDFSFELGGRSFSTVSVLIGLTMILFALTELFPNWKKLPPSPTWLMFGGILSGFFGGRSGHQGALRSVFLAKLPWSPKAYIATGVAIALLVDLTRIPVYFSRIESSEILNQWGLLLASVLAAFVGAYWGKRNIEKVTMKSIHLLVGYGMIIIAFMVMFTK
jgi:uncharacterized membrane protein YfcA